MNNTTKTVLVGIIVVVLVIVGYHIFSKPKTLGGAVNVTSGQLIEDNMPYYRNNGGLNTNLPELIGADVKVTGGTVEVTTTNTATSTVIVGCIQSYATSTATSQVLQATTTAPSMAMWVYGTCPNL